MPLQNIIRGEPINQLPLVLDLYLVVQVAVYHYAATVLANNYLLMLADLALPLRRYHIEAATARVAHDRHYSKAVTI